MRKLLVMMLSLALCFSMSVTASAADTSADSEASETDYDVCLFVDDTGENPVVELQALNAVTDGVVTITYDTSVVSVEESDVTANMDAVDKYSINAEEAGTLKISWISEEEATGTLFTLGFTLSDSAEITDAAFSLSGDVRNADGALMILKSDADVEEVNKEILQALNNTSLTLDEENYTEDSWAVFAQAQEAAYAVLTDADATQAEVDEALEALTAAFMGLIPVQETEETDKSDLQALYTNALLLTESDYTSESWAAFDEAMKSALTVLNNEDATQDEIDAEWQTLLDATNALELGDTDNVNLDALLLLYETSLKLTESDYTSESWASLVTAQAGALAVLNDTDPTQEEADDALNVLIEALKGLVRVSDDSGETDGSDDSGETGGSDDAGGTSTTVNRAPLQAAYDASVPLTESKYTPESWAVFAEARAAALVVLEDENATQTEVDAALATLLDAMNGLVTLVDSATTGDSSSIGLWIAIAVVALIAIIVVIVVYRKRMGKGGEK